MQCKAKLNHPFGCSSVVHSFLCYVPKPVSGARDTTVTKHTLPFGAYTLAMEPDLYYVLDSSKAKIIHFLLLLFTHD